MRTKLIHPLWTHIPAIAVFIILIVNLIKSSPLPADAPVHFRFNGVPDSYGSPWLSFGLTVGLSIFFISLSVFLDEIWARQERSKTFNWFSLLDEVVVGVMAGISLGYLAFLENSAGTFSFPREYVLLVGGGSAALAILFEVMRPFHPYPGQIVNRDAKAFKAELAKRLRENTPFAYWDSQNPLYVSILSIMLPLVMLVAAVLSWFNQPGISLLLIVLGILFTIPYGGQRTLVTRQGITVRFGIAGIRILRLKKAQIACVELHEFSPLKDFGGYGIRFNRDMKAYFLRGSHGVKITTLNGKKYLIGSDHPEQLADIIGAVSLAS